MKKLNFIHLKKVTIGVSLFFVLFLSYSLIFRLGPTVGFILSLVLKPQFQIEKIEFVERGLIVARGVTMSYGGHKMTRAPKVRVEYNLNGEIRDWIRGIDVYDAEFLILRKGSSINVADAFSTGGDNKTGTGVPLKIVRIINGSGIFRDLSYDHPIEKPISRLDGFITFDRIMGIDSLFYGDTEGSPISFSFTNYFEDYSMRIKAKDINIDTNILQYAYYYEGVNYFDGKGEIDITIADSGLYGFAKISGLDIMYDSFLEKAKNFEGEVKFLKDTITLDGNFELFNKKRELKMDYNGERGLDLRLLLGKLTWEEVSHYKLLNSLGLERDLNFRDATVVLRTDEENNFFVDIDTSLEDFELGGMYWKNINPKITYEHSIDTTNVSVDKGTLKILGVDEKLALNFKYKDDKGIFDYSINDFHGNIGLFFRANSLYMRLNSGLLVGKADYNYDEKKLKFHNGKLMKRSGELIYNFDTMNLEKFTGDLNINFLNKLHGVINGKIENNKGELEKILLTSNKNEEIVRGTGKVNLNKENFQLDFKTKVNYENKELQSSVIGEIEGNAKILQGKYQVDLQGDLNSLKYKEFEINDVKTKLRINSHGIDIKNFNNDKIQLQGKVDLTNSKLDLKYTVKGLSNEDIKIEEIRFEDLDATGSIVGDFKSPVVDYNIVNSNFYPAGDTPVILKSNGKLKNNIIEVSRVTLNNRNNFVGRYNLTDETYFLQGDILTEDLPRYIDSKGFEYLVTGKLDVEGKSGQITGNLNYRVESIRNGEIRFPNLVGRLTYESENYTDGIVGIDHLTLVRNRRNIGTMRGNINLKTRQIALNLNERQFNFRNIVEGRQVPSIKGIGELGIRVSGTLDAPLYGININSNEIIIDKVVLNKFNVLLNGENSKMKLEEFSFLYGKNKLETTGYYDLAKDEYSFNVFSKDIDLSFLTALEQFNTIEKMGGHSKIDLTFTNSGNRGFISGDKIFIKSKNKGVDINNVAYKVELKDRKIEIDHFGGKINGGDLSLKGYVVVPKIDEIQNNPNLLEELDYKFNLMTKGVKVVYPKHFFFVVDSNLEIASSKLTGYLRVVEGEVTRIPGVSEGINIFSLLLDYIARIARIRTDSGGTKYQGIEERSNFGHNISVDLDLKIVEGIRLRLESIAGIIEEVRGEIIGGGRVLGKNGNYNFLGGFDWLNGSFLFNYLKFTVREGGLTFHRENEFYPDFNPTIRFDSHATDRMNYFEIGLRGESRNLNYRIRRNSEVSSGRLSTLFSADSEHSGEAQNFLIKGILSHQISNLFFRPFLSEVRKMLGLSSLRAISTIEGVNVQSETEREQNNMGYVFGIKLQAKKMIYENIYLVAEAGVTEGQISNNRDGGDSNSGSYNQYMLGLEYELGHGKYAGIGVSRTSSNNSDNSTTGRQDTNTDNYYINFIFNRRYDNLSDIIKNIF